MEGFNKGQRFIVLVILFLLLFFSITTFGNTGSLRTDSGWDTDYGGGWSDSGGGWSSSDSWSSSDWSSDSWSSDSSWSSRPSRYHGGRPLKDSDVILIFVGIIMLLIIIGFPYILRDLTNSNSRDDKKKYKPVDKYGDKVTKYEEFMANYDNIMEGLDKGVVADTVEDHEITDLLPDETRESLLEKLYNIFVEVQKAWMEFDYDKLRELCSDELYNTYESQLEALKLKNGKNIMDNFELVFSDITGLKEIDGVVIIDMYLKVSFNDFVIDVDSKKVTRGRDDILVTNNYKLQFVIGKDDNKDTCPNCGAKITNNTSGVCEYCGSHVVIKPKNYVLNKKTIIK